MNEGFDYPKKPESEHGHAEFVRTSKEIERLREALKKVTGGQAFDESDVGNLDDFTNATEKAASTHEQRERLKELIKRYDKLKQQLGDEVNPKEEK
jgi:hypothetical protein